MVTLKLNGKEIAFNCDSEMIKNVNGVLVFNPKPKSYSPQDMGESILCKVANMLINGLGVYDTIGRYIGDLCSDFPWDATRFISEMHIIQHETYPEIFKEFKKQFPDAQLMGDNETSCHYYDMGDGYQFDIAIPSHRWLAYKLADIIGDETAQDHLDKIDRPSDEELNEHPACDIIKNNCDKW